MNHIRQNNKYYASPFDHSMEVHDAFSFLDFWVEWDSAHLFTTNLFVHWRSACIIGVKFVLICVLNLYTTQSNKEISLYFEKLLIFLLITTLDPVVHAGKHKQCCSRWTRNEPLNQPLPLIPLRGIFFVGFVHYSMVTFVRTISLHTSNHQNIEEYTTFFGIMPMLDLCC